MGKAELLINALHHRLTPTEDEWQGNTSKYLCIAVTREAGYTHTKDVPENHILHEIFTDISKEIGGMICVENYLTKKTNSATVRQCFNFRIDLAQKLIEKYILEEGHNMVQDYE